MHFLNMTVCCPGRVHCHSISQHIAGLIVECCIGFNPAENVDPLFPCLEDVVVSCLALTTM